MTRYELRYKWWIICHCHGLICGSLSSLSVCAIHFDIPHTESHNHVMYLFVSSRVQSLNRAPHVDGLLLSSGLQSFVCRQNNKNTAILDWQKSSLALGSSRIVIIFTSIHRFAVQLAIARQVMRQLTEMWKSSEIGRKLNNQLVKLFLWSIALYGSEEVRRNTDHGV